MAFQISFFLIFTGLTGIDSVTTISKVSVEAGQSISIPCLYGPNHKNNVKYLCQGYEWSSCTYAIRTGQPNSDRFSISDDKNQGIFTVTIRPEQTDHYWCFVEMDRRADTGQRFHLSVTTGTPSLYVDQQNLTASEGENVVITCHYSNSGTNKWCRLGGGCIIESTGWMDGTQVNMTSRSNNYFTVEMSGLKTENSGWYYCVRGDHQMPVHLTVNEQPISTGNKLMRAIKNQATTSRGTYHYNSELEEEVKYSPTDHTDKTTRKVQPKAEDDNVIYSTWAQQK
ncbi:uncharacterized protein LOC119917590 isoform X2 [Xyrichtys novacula]|uniref:Uncharacterized protein LOC119917590 isoform X2 n=1 Tax=Xyrichtys novacula TaxID=13765 RepID=A0AAV1G436_XYRNO|nr:uncharacterized protein LOC119917590 isoform X2 [Xyrichtys novacula]